MRKNLLKRYNDFIKINENQETETPVKPETAPTETPTETPDKRRERYTIPTPSVNPDPLAETEVESSREEGVEDNLEYLHDTLEGSELMGNILKYQGHEITLPSETGEFEVDGVRKIKKDGNKLTPTSSAEDVIEYLNNPEAQTEAKTKQNRKLQAQAQRAQAQVQKQAQVEESVDYTMGRTENQLPNPPEEIELNINDEEEEDFETQTGKDPEAEALSGEHVDVEKTGKTHNETKSYRNRFRTKL
jgi:hypothetical protein